MAESRSNRKSQESGERQFEVLVSFDGLNLGDRFSSEPDAWTNTHVENGYLRDVTKEPTVAESQGRQAPEAAPEAVEGARDAGEKRQG